MDSLSVVCWGSMRYLPTGNVCVVTRSRQVKRKNGSTFWRPVVVHIRSLSVWSNQPAYFAQLFLPCNVKYWNTIKYCTSLAFYTWTSVIPAERTREVWKEHLIFRGWQYSMLCISWWSASLQRKAKLTELYSWSFKTQPLCKNLQHNVLIRTTHRPLPNDRGYKLLKNYGWAKVNLIAGGIVLPPLFIKWMNKLNQFPLPV